MGSTTRNLETIKTKNLSEGRTPETEGKEGGGRMDKQRKCRESISSPGVIRQRESKHGNHDAGPRRWRRFHTRTGWLHLKTMELQTVEKLVAQFQPTTRILPHGGAPKPIGTALVKCRCTICEVSSMSARIGKPFPGSAPALAKPAGRVRATHKTHSSRGGRTNAVDATQPG